MSRWPIESQIEYCEQLRADAESRDPEPERDERDEYHADDDPEWGNRREQADGELRD